ncbi:alpha/beta hydrolase family protein [Phycisphaerales bacterium AB-hyl4]|uniref:Alpha/beta hydrolase family protein n=1 Tax=Natronomicrosphaera hydrolytica TaxID=3242702 RepID=A0ABV4U9Z8_9BACT
MLASARFNAGFAGSDFKRWQLQARAVLAELVGFDPDRRPAFTTVRLWQRSHCLGHIEKWLLRAEPGIDVPIYWCRPARPHESNPTMICLQGHTTGMHCSIGASQADPFIDEAPPNDRDYALQCLAHGFNALCVEQRGFGERRENCDLKTDCQHMAMRALLLGRTLVGERVADAQLALRWALQQPTVNAHRVGIMGNSAGGTTAMYAAALMDNFWLAVPSCSFGRLRDTWFAGRRCVCGYVPRLLNTLDLPDVLALHAPNPVIVVGGEQDYHAPGKALRPAFADLQTRYAASGAAEACRLVIGPEGHRFYASLAWPLMLQQLDPA